ncbi:GNAT family N-acetyltransferase [Streptomyces sp. NPDC057654]|uniref:GNAT family N-acetyltransferase n=1 Tax=Streptomyces sp. NPDC057654 TaxID=3346196 RepID=UPI0036909FFA
MSVQLTVGSTASLPALALRPWQADDIDALVSAHRDPVLRRWLRNVIKDDVAARHWLDDQRQGWADGTQFGFAVTEDAGEGFGAAVGHVVVKVADEGSAEVGYWSATEGRSRGLVSRALEAAVRWVFSEAFPVSVVRLDLLHAVGNHGSCRVAERCGFAFAAILPPQPPAFPKEGHLHVRHRPAVA